MDADTLWVIAGFSGAIGVLIGCVGIGGVLLVPMLAVVAGIEIHTAIAAAMLSYLFSGAAAAIIYERRGSIRWDMSGWLWAGAMPAAFVGAAVSWATPGRALEIIIAVLVLYAGFRSLRPRADNGPNNASPNGLGLSAIGGVTGFGSAMTGTGGPLILMPILVWIQVPVLTAVGLSQAIQIPIAALATAGNLYYGEIDFVIAGVIAVTLTTGATLGAQFAHALPQRILRRIAALVMFGVGLFMVARIAQAW